MTNYKQLCAELSAALEDWQLGGASPEDDADRVLIDRARAALAAKPEPEGEDPTDAELYDLADEYNGEPVASMRAALARWGKSTSGELQP